MGFACNRFISSFFEFLSRPAIHEPVVVQHYNDPENNRGHRELLRMRISGLGAEQRRTDLIVNEVEQERSPHYDDRPNRQVHFGRELFRPVVKIEI